MNQRSEEKEPGQQLKIELITGAICNDPRGKFSPARQDVFKREGQETKIDQMVSLKERAGQN